MRDHRLPAARRGTRRMGPTRLRALLAALMTLLLLSTVTACASGFPDSSTTSGTSAGKTTSATDTDGSIKLCGLPPCTRFVSRAEVKKLNTDVTQHTIASAVVWKVAFDILCGGILCLLGAGISYDYVQNRIKDAAGLDDCLRIQIGRSSPHSKLIQVNPSNLKPYCKA